MGLMDFTKEQPKASSFYKDLERVECVIYDITIPNIKLQAYKDIISINPDYKISYKDFGLAYKVAVIRRNLDSNWENGIYIISDELPNIPISTIIDMLKPEDIYNHSYPYVYDKGLSSTLTSNGPDIISMFPSTYVNTKTNSPEEIARIKNKQKEEWKRLILNYEQASEEEAVMYLKDRLSRRYGIGVARNNLIDFIGPDIGVTFTGFVKPSKYPFFSVNPIQYDKNSKNYIIGSKLSSEKTATTIELAKNIKKMIEKNKQEIAEKKKNNNEYNLKDDEGYSNIKFLLDDDEDDEEKF